MAGNKIEDTRAHFQAASAKSLAWANPQQRLAALATRTGRLAEAQRSYARTAALAPRWGRLNLEWADARRRVGRRAEAQRKLQAAVAQDLSGADRAVLERMK